MFQFNEISLWCLSTHRIFSEKVWQPSLWLIKLNFTCFHTSPASPILPKGKDYNNSCVINIYHLHPALDSEHVFWKWSKCTLFKYHIQIYALSTPCRLFEAMAHTSLCRSPLQTPWCSKSKRSSINLWMCKIILQIETVFLITDFFFWTDFTGEHKLHPCFYKIHIWSSNFIFYSQQVT